MRAAGLKTFAAIALVAALGFPLVSCSSSSEEPAPGPPYTGDPGPYRVGHLSYLVSDAARSDRPVAINVWYPADPAAISAASPAATYPFAPFGVGRGSSSSAEWEALGYDRAHEGPATSRAGPFPLVVLSPGHTCPSWYHVGLAARLATYGYVTAVLDHFGEGYSPVTITVQELMFHRPRDVSFAITDLVARSDTPGELLHGAIDKSVIAAGGHSLGGYTAYALAAGDDLVCDSAVALSMDRGLVPSTCLPTPADGRISVIVSLDGAAHLLRYAELARASVPSLLLGRTVANLMPYEGIPFDTLMARPHAAIPRTDSYRVDVEGTQHNSFSHLCDGLGIAVRHGHVTAQYAEHLRSAAGCNGALTPAKVHQVMTRYVVAFLNVHLLGITSDAVTLTEADAATHTPAVHFFQTEACSTTLPDETYFSYRTLQTGGVCAVAKKDPVEYFAPP